MQRRRFWKKVLLAIWTISLMTGGKSEGYDEQVVHPTINDKAAERSESFLSALRDIWLATDLRSAIGGKAVRDWFRRGGTIEDKPDCRTRNHFHDPLKTWEEAGFNNIVTAFCPLYTASRSSLIWAQIPAAPPGNTYSWIYARQHYYNALTSSVQAVREQEFGRCLEALGGIMHLIADASVPGHVRNDSHVLAGVDKPALNYESWTKLHFSELNYSPWAVDPSIFSHSVYNQWAPVPISALWDIDRYTGDNLWDTTIGPIGLAEYTNANFFSEDTVFRNYPHPSYADTDFHSIDWANPMEVDAEDGKIDLKVYVMKTLGERLNRLVAVSYLALDLGDQIGWGLRPPILDEEVLKEYASKLIPRAVGYSAALLDYFFRGIVEIRLPNTSVYAVTDKPDEGFKTVTLLVRNITPSGEEMSGGSLTLVAKFKVASSDPFHSGMIGTSEEFSYVVTPPSTDRFFIPKDGFLEVVFHLPQPIAIWATDLSFQLVYQGQLGAEADAVAVGFKDVSEPTPIDIFNNADMICLHGNWYVAGSPAAIALVDSNGDGRPDLWDVYPHDLANIYVKFSPSAAPEQASSENFDLVVPWLEAGTFCRAYVLADEHFSVSNEVTQVKRIEADPWGSVVEKLLRPATAVKRQQGYPPPSYFSFRGEELWGGAGAVTVNREYPFGASCALELLR